MKNLTLKEMLEIRFTNARKSAQMLGRLKNIEELDTIPASFLMQESFITKELLQKLTLCKINGFSFIDKIKEAYKEGSFWREEFIELEILKPFQDELLKKLKEDYMPMGDFAKMIDKTTFQALISIPVTEKVTVYENGKNPLDFFVKKDYVKNALK